MNQQLINKYDSDFCGSLPIHLINVIQAYGALIVIERSSGLIAQVSENVAAVIKTPVGQLLGQPASQFLDISQLESATGTTPQVWIISGTKYLCILHPKELYYILEINLQSTEEALQASPLDLREDLKQSIEAIESTGSLDEISRIAARELKRASGFDKVMIYRFDENWNGFVMAEEGEPDMESFLGFTFPASDIPRQARELYLHNAYRLIPNREYQPVRLYPFVNPVTDTFLDMGDCNVRGVSTVHLEYLKNMHVTASMSTRILKDNKLWGLIACHHKKPLAVKYKMCAIFESLSEIISAKISSLQDSERHSFDVSLDKNFTMLAEKTFQCSSLTAGLLDSPANVMDLFHASGVVVVNNGKTSVKGWAPEQSQIEDLLLWLTSLETGSVYHTDCLSRHYDYARDYRQHGSGLLAIPIDVAGGSYILIFRPEVVQVINWGGDPETRINFEPDLKTYHPRFSFKIWQEKVVGVSLPWHEKEIVVAEGLKKLTQSFLDKENIPYR